MGGEKQMKLVKKENSERAGTMLGKGRKREKGEGCPCVVLWTRVEIGRRAMAACRTNLTYSFTIMEQTGHGKWKTKEMGSVGRKTVAVNNVSMVHGERMRCEVWALMCAGLRKVE